MGAGRSRRNQPVSPYYPTYGGGVAPGYTITTPPVIYETPYEQVDYTEIYIPTARGGGRRPVIYVAAPFPGGLGSYGGFGGGLGGFGGGLGGLGGGLGGLGGYGGGFPGLF